MPNESSFYESFHRSFTDAVAKSYPSTAARFNFADRIVSTLIAPYVLELPASVKTQAESIVQAFFNLRSLPEWQAHCRAQLPAVTEPGNTSILMSYDFHVDTNGALRLIEINTNASLSLVVDELHRFQKVENPFTSGAFDFRDEILNSFEREFRDAKTHGSLSRIAIVDQNPERQRLFIEFAMYQELFARRNWKADFYDPSELACANHTLESRDEKIDLVYNRDTDFYFSGEASSALRHAMTGNCAVITPHPWEYRLLADKDRLLELSRADLLESLPLTPADRDSIAQTLIRTLEVRDLDPDELWADRKRWFFKPRRSHGGKAVYRGSSTSRGTFQSILAGDYLAQEMVSPPTVRFDGEAEELKYDLRFYVYRDKIQLACARLYRGQMTNSQTLGGGVSPIHWKI
jgi:hypothetical protein